MDTREEKRLRQSRIPSVTIGALKQTRATLDQLTRAWIKPIGSKKCGEAKWLSSHERQYLEEEDCPQRSPPMSSSPPFIPSQAGAFHPLHVPHPHPPLHPYYPHLHRSESLEKAIAAGQRSHPQTSESPFLKPLNRIARAHDGRFVIDASSSSDEGGFVPRPSWHRPRPRPIFPRPRPLPLVAPGSPQVSGRASMRSDGSGESSLMTKIGSHQHLQSNVGPSMFPAPRGLQMIAVPATMYTPHFRASSPGPMAPAQATGGEIWFSPTSIHNFSDLSSVPLASSVERSLPTSAATHSGISGVNSSLRSVHARYAQELPSLRAIHEENGRWQWVRTEVHQHHHHPYRHPGPPPSGAVLATTPLTHRQSGRHIHEPSLLLHHQIHPHTLLPHLVPQQQQPLRAMPVTSSHLHVAIPSNNQIPPLPVGMMSQAASKHHHVALGGEVAGGRLASEVISKPRPRLHSRALAASGLRHSRSAPELGSAENYAASLRASLASASSRGSQRVHRADVVVGHTRGSSELLHEASPESRSSSSGFGSKNTSQQNQSSHSGQSPLDGSSISAEWRGGAPLLQQASPAHHHHIPRPVVGLMPRAPQPGPPYRPPPPPPPWTNPRQIRPQFITASAPASHGIHFVPHLTRGGISHIVRGVVPQQEVGHMAMQLGWPALSPKLNQLQELVIEEQDPLSFSSPKIPLLPPPPSSPTFLSSPQMMEPSGPEVPDVSVDDHYEFDSFFAADGTPTPGTPNQRSAGGSISGFGGSAGGMSDSEVYSLFYPRPNKPSKYENMEARVQAMKEEFHAYRQRQAKRSKVEESAC